MRRYIFIMLVCTATQWSQAQEPVVIESFGNGSLSWTNDVTNVQYRVEWASSLDGPWYYSWELLNHMPSGTNLNTTAPVPMFFRVVTLPEENERPSISADPSTILDQNLDKTILTASGGVEPYTWSVDDVALGQIDASSGYSIVYTRFGPSDNVVRVTDALAEYTQIVIEQP